MDDILPTLLAIVWRLMSCIETLERFIMFWFINTFQITIYLQQTTLKTCRQKWIDISIKVSLIMKICEKIVTKGEISYLEQGFFLPQRFQKSSAGKASFVVRIRKRIDVWPITQLWLTSVTVSVLNIYNTNNKHLLSDSILSLPKGLLKWYFYQIMLFQPSFW